MEKMTKKEMFALIKAIPDVASNKDMVAFIDHELELLARKNSADRNPTASQLENKKIKAYIVANLPADKRFTITEMIKGVLNGTEWAELTCSRLTAICTQMVESGELVREVEKRKAYYRLAATTNA